MNLGDVVAYIGVPLGLFLLTAAGSGIVALIKLTSYFASSKAAQESTALSNAEISKKLDAYCGQTDHKLTEYGERLVVLEFAIKPRTGR
jgi:hypothetical protein